jgi:hypothetical protein
LTDQQLTNRKEVLDLAGALMAGSRLQGKTINREDALQMAFDSVTSGKKTQAAREEITSKLKAREKGISMKPGGRPSTPLKGAKAKDRADLESKVRNQLSELFSRS